MTWDTLAQFLHMNGHGFYVWSAYGMALFLLVFELVTLRRRRTKAMDRLNREARAERASRQI